MEQLELFEPRRSLRPRRNLQANSAVPRGYAAMPGGGPAGETCGSCTNLVRKRLSKIYRKCGLMERSWTGGAGTDVLAGSPACKRWEPKSREATP